MKPYSNPVLDLLTVNGFDLLTTSPGAVEGPGDQFGNDPGNLFGI